VREVAPSGEFPVLRCLPTAIESRLDDFTSASRGRVLHAIANAAPTLSWRQTYTAREVDAEFLANYAWTEILGPVGPIAAERITSGLLLLGSGTFYPPHRHLAEEIYVPVSGTAEWQQGVQAWISRRPESVIYHRSEERHAMRTAAEPLLALYIWRATDAAGTALNLCARLEA
jgi:hypothetical protein